jgi:glycine cleavage system aminomethyltransferase T
VELMGAHLSPLDDELKRSGAHMTEREGWLVAADFGSVATEIAVSRGTAGLTDVSDAGKLEVRGSPEALAEVHPSARELKPGLATETADAWWCVVSPEMLVVLTTPAATESVRADLASRAEVEDLQVADVTEERVAVCLTGPSARGVLTRARVRDSRIGGVSVENVHGVPAIVLRQRKRQWLLVAPRSDARALWRGLTEDGAPFGLAYVGADALRHLRAAATG